MGSLLSSSLLRVIRPTSMRSSTSRTSCSTCRSIVARACWITAASPLARFNSSSDVLIGAQRVAEFVRQDCQKLVLAVVGLSQGVLGLVAVGHVPENQHAADDGAVLAPDRRGAVVDGHGRAVLADEHGVVGRPDDRSIPQHARRGTLNRLTGLLAEAREHALELQSQGFPQGPACHDLRDGVQEGDAAPAVGGDDRVPDAGQRHPHELRLCLGPPSLPVQGFANDADTHADHDETHPLEEVDQIAGREHEGRVGEGDRCPRRIRVPPRAGRA